MYEHLESKEKYREFYEQQGKQGYSNQHITEDWGRIKPHIPYYKDAIVYEAGSQTGGCTKIIAKYARHIVTCDISESYLTKAKIYLKDEIGTKVTLQKDFVEDNLNRWTEYFDIVVCYEIFEHVKDDKRLIEIAFKALKKDGILLFSVPLEDIFPDPLGEHIRQYKVSDVLKLFASHDVTIRIAPEKNPIWIVGEARKGVI